MAILHFFYPKPVNDPLKRWSGCRVFRATISRVIRTVTVGVLLLTVRSVLVTPRGESFLYAPAWRKLVLKQPTVPGFDFYHAQIIFFCICLPIVTMG